MPNLKSISFEISLGTSGKSFYKTTHCGVTLSERRNGKHFMAFLVFIDRKQKKHGGYWAGHYPLARGRMNEFLCYGVAPPDESF